MLSRFGKYMMVKNSGSLKARFDWGDALADSAIVGGIAFGNALLGAASDGSISSFELTLSMIGGFLSFLGWLAAKRKLTPPTAPAA